VKTEHRVIADASAITDTYHWNDSYRIE